MATEYSVQGIGIGELADRYGTPLYVYDGAELTGRLRALYDALPARLEIFFSLKSNPNIAICAVLHGAGARAEVSSMTELLTALRAGVPPRDIVFLGPGKSRAELDACLEHGIATVIVESFGELELLDELAGARGVRANVALRVNPSFAVKGSGLTMGGKPRQFGIDEEQLLAEPDLGKRLPNVRLHGVQAYMGTRILSEEAVVANTVRILDLAERISTALDFPLEFADVGGGLGVAYFDGEEDLDVEVLTTSLAPVLTAFADAHPHTRIVMELGRYLTATSGVYVTRVRYVKTSMGERFAVSDGGTNHHMAAVGIGSFVKRNFPVRLLNRIDEPATGEWTVTGPLCTPNDTLLKKAALPDLGPGDLLGILRSGAYGPSASPVHFLSHGYPAEVLVHEGRHHIIRDRDTPEDLLRAQHLPN
ncbi:MULTISPECIES: type III PLP-dependent enzyme [Dactylosporangium]|uniref:Diaminopimelate decarboxylase n=2 Tax=Dactylosporangium TaxID=35753 RepID=A0A9W6KHZ2_9ACTN|nr:MULTISPECIES: type III PLP-dependent enzyme [Dactylosporangium]UAB94056.1 type III PLP-dependent enzyme [Dactylosporangium vinaceum]UWZ42466.1 type III PLP-dependent enzyme [Dactylosporangium matsuzakiense]GLL00621.1 diaminopimelate decarboxylase [Dactylosporangium matsuzakiense]